VLPEDVREWAILNVNFIFDSELMNWGSASIDMSEMVPKSSINGLIPAW